MIDLDSDYYTKWMIFIMRNQPNSKGKAQDDSGFLKLATSSLWRCGDNGWIIFELYCSKGVILNSQKQDDTVVTDSCIDPLDKVP